MSHEYVSDAVRAILRAAGRPAFFTGGPLGVDLHPSYRIPDLIVVSAELVTAVVNPIPARDVLLALEIVSPGSVTTDRITKPAQYAEYGIPAYWRVETLPEVTLTAHELVEGATAYREVGTWRAGETAHLTRPFPVDIPIDQLVP